MKIFDAAKRAFRGNTFAGNVGVLVGGTASAQILILASAPLLTRLYTPEDFGVLAVYAALLAFYSIISSLRYELAIPIQESNKDAVPIVILCLIIVLIMTAISAFMIVLIGEKLAGVLGAEGLSGYFWLLPVGIFLSGVYNVFHYWAIRTRNFSNIAKTNITQALTTIILQVIGFKFGSVALIIGQTGGQGAGSIRLGREALKYEEMAEWRWREVWCAARKHYRFPFFSTWSALFNAAGTQLPPIMFSIFFNSSAAGLYALANRVLALPTSILGGAIGSVFLSQATEAIKNNQLRSLVEKIHKNLSEIAMPFVLILMLAAPDLFSFFFGEPWRQAGVFASWLSPFLYVQFVTSPISTLHSVVGKQAQGMLFHGILLVSRILSITIGAAYNDLLLSVQLFALSSTICWIGFLIWLLGLANCSPFRTIVGTTSKTLVLSSGIVLPTLISIYCDASFYFILLALFFSGVIVSCRIYYLANASS
ncbi:MAG: lipopolysaccharide biosynthesis protein [Marinobacter sp.]|nr:lipopolysaccharide biosynthesis protein [Marinobacter sp.]